jgi:hypothetical protein
MDEDERPFIVGIGWITKCKERGERQDEEPYRVAVEEEDVFQKVSRCHFPHQPSPLM